MRYITPPAPNEKLIATGTYLYYLNSQPAGVSEPWEIYQRPDGTRATHVERDAKAFGSTIAVEAHEKDGHFVKFDVAIWRGDTLTAQAHYKFRGASFRVTRNGVAGPVTELAVGTVVYPLMRVFLGAVIRRVAAANRPVPVLTPFLENPDDTEKLLSATISERIAKHLATESVEVDGHIVTARRYQFLSPQYDENSAFWLDDNGLLVRYLFHQSVDKAWDTVLLR